MLTTNLKVRSIFVCILIGVQSLVELVGASSLIPFLYSLLEPDKLLQNKYFSKIFYFFHAETSGSVIIISSCLVAFVFFIRMIFNVFSTYIQLNFENYVMKYMSLTMLSSYLKRPYTDMLEINSAEALRGIGTDATSTYYVLQNIFQLLSNVLKLVVFISLMVLISPFMAFGAGFGAIVCIIFLFALLKRTVSKSGKEFDDAMFLTTKVANESLSGIKEITVLGRNDFFIKRFEEVSEQKRKSEFRYRFLQQTPNIIISDFFISIIIIIAGVSCMFSKAPTSFIPKLAVFAYSGLNLMKCVSGISGNITTIIYYIASFNKAYENISIAREYQQVLRQNAYLLKKYENNLSDKIFTKNLVLNNVIWKYSTARKNVLEGISLTINKGDSIALTGASGSGKTTVADIILGLLKPQEGSVEVDGRSIFDIPTTWSKTVGYVAQMPFLLDDTIRNNILFGQLGYDGVDEDVWNALAQANIKDYIQSLPNGLNTVVGERGVKFSGGQRQRLAIARALFDNPELLVLDEATSALDTETEKAVMEVVESLRGNKTIIIIAHRLSTIEKCNVVYRIQDGKCLRIR